MSKKRAQSVSEDGYDSSDSDCDAFEESEALDDFRRRKKLIRGNPKFKNTKCNLVEPDPDPLVGCGCDIMLLIFSHLDARSAATSLLVSRTWRTVASCDTIWSKKCEELWTGKAHLPRFVHVDGLSRLSAYSLSVKDGKRDAPEYWRNMDPYWRGTEPPMHRYFHPDGSQTADCGDRAWGGHECCYSIVTSVLADGSIREHYVRINRWPQMYVSRRDDWGWEMSNSLYCYSSVPDAAKKDELMSIRNPNFLVGGVNWEQRAGKEHLPPPLSFIKDGKPAFQDHPMIHGGKLLFIPQNPSIFQLQLIKPRWRNPSHPSSSGAHFFAS